jgi:hypothetical protein
LKPFFFEIKIKKSGTIKKLYNFKEVNNARNIKLKKYFLLFKAKNITVKIGNASKSIHQYFII